MQLFAWLVTIIIIISLNKVTIEPFEQKSETDLVQMFSFEIQASLFPSFSDIAPST